MALTSLIKLNIAKKLEKDKAFRGRFFRGQAQDEIAMSIKGLRKKRQMRQADLAKESDMKQSAISRIEKADYSAWSFNTLFRIADSLGARLRVTFEPIEDVIEKYKEKEAAISQNQKPEQYATLHLSDVSKSKVGVISSTPNQSSNLIENMLTITTSKILLR